MRLRAVYMEYSECLPTLLNPLAERACFSQVINGREGVGKSHLLHCFARTVKPTGMRVLYGSSSTGQASAAPPPPARVVSVTIVHGAFFHVDFGPRCFGPCGLSCRA